MEIPGKSRARDFSFSPEIPTLISTDENFLVFIAIGLHRADRLSPNNCG